MSAWNRCSRVLRLSLGNALEWYDFCLYGYFASTIAVVFFERSDPTTGLIYAFGTFAIGSLARPLGGIVFGYLGDRIGRYFAMNLAIALMGISSILAAFLPGYQTIGVMAPLLLVVLRILQGISAGGQFGNLIVITAEDRALTRTGFYMGITFAVSILGFLLASVVSYLTLSLSPESWKGFIWRLPFLLGGVLLLLQRWSIRSLQQEAEPPAKSQKTPLKELLSQYKSSLALVVLLSFSCGSIYYLVFTYLVNYMVQYSGVTLVEALELNSWSLLGACILIPLFGWASDLWGRRKVLVLGVLFGMLVLSPAMQLLHDATPGSLLLALSLFCLMISWIQGAVPPFFGELFPPEIRASGCCSAFGIGSALSGISPFLAAEFASRGTMSIESLFWLMLVCALATAFCLPGRRYATHQGAALAAEH
ncbi:MFS transporter [Dongshaea marina]|uniref:MFS transporter n=1 Tax=Dongshaea marina TaxID=2047966 RepID=UPI000D3EADF1|nr:MFS transporter [Dongshaea marina]